jgi:hypothetical protein
MGRTIRNEPNRSRKMAERFRFEKINDALEYAAMMDESDDTDDSDSQGSEE